MLDQTPPAGSWGQLGQKTLHLSVNNVSPAWESPLLETIAHDNMDRRDKQTDSDHLFRAPAQQAHAWHVMKVHWDLVRSFELLFWDPLKFYRYTTVLTLYQTHSTIIWSPNNIDHQINEIQKQSFRSTSARSTSARMTCGSSSSLLPQVLSAWLFKNI